MSFFDTCNAWGPTLAVIATLLGIAKTIASSLKSQSQEIKQLQADFKTDMKEQNARFDTRYEKLHEEIKQQNARFDSEIKQQNARFDAEIKEQNARFDTERKEQATRIEHFYEMFIRLLEKQKETKNI